MKRRKLKVYGTGRGGAVKQTFRLIFVRAAITQQRQNGRKLKVYGTGRD